jgi:hypothetical protein
MGTLRFDKLKLENKTESLVALFELLANEDPRLRPTWASRLPQILQENGFVDVEQDSRDAPPHLAFQFHECGLLIPELVARKTKNEHMFQELKRVLPAAIKETNSGAYHACLRFTAIGRKPSRV